MKDYRETGHGSVHQPLVELHGGQCVTSGPETYKLS
jgi:hypothetical protein